MNLRITSYGNFLKIKGDLNRRNVHMFKAELLELLERESRIIIDVESLEHIDRHGIKAILDLHKESIRRNKNVSIIGSGPTTLYNRFKSDYAA